MNSTWKGWLKGLGAAFISGATSYIIGGAIDPKQIRLILILSLIHGVVSGAAYLSKSPLPGIENK